MKKFLIVVSILVGLFLLWWVGSAGYYSWKTWRIQKKTNDFQNALSQPYREDTYGGKTPEETWAMFLEALKNKDAELAGKYFVVEKQEEWKKIIEDTIKDGKIESIIQNSSVLRHDHSNDSTAYYFRNVEKGGKSVSSPVNFILNPYTKVWKIYVL